MAVVISLASWALSDHDISGTVFVINLKHREKDNSSAANICLPMICDLTLSLTLYTWNISK